MSDEYARPKKKKMLRNRNKEAPLHPHYTRRDSDRELMDPGETTEVQTAFNDMMVDFMRINQVSRIEIGEGPGTSIYTTDEECRGVGGDPVFFREEKITTAEDVMHAILEHEALGGTASIVVDLDDDDGVLNADLPFAKFALESGRKADYPYVGAKISINKSSGPNKAGPGAYDLTVRLEGAHLLHSIMKPRLAALMLLQLHIMAVDYIAGELKKDED
jgi:hypothetical protein